MYKTIRQNVKLKGTSKAIYALLTDAQKHGAFELATEVGGRLSAFGGAITGINVELTPNKRIVQMWRAKDWPKGHYSTATFELAAADGGTALAFTQTGVPESKFDDIRTHRKMWTPPRSAAENVGEKGGAHIFRMSSSKGWRELYWDKLKKFLAK